MVLDIKTNQKVQKNIQHEKDFLDLQFLKICKDYNVIPKFLLFKVANSNLHSSSKYKRCQRKLLQEEVYNKKLDVSKLDREPKLFYNKGSSIKNVHTNLGIFSTPLSLSRPVHIWLTTLPPPVRADIRLALFETLQLVSNSHWRVKKTDYSDTGCTHMCVPIRQFR